MNLMTLMRASLAFGLIAALLWVVFWGVTFPGVLTTYRDYTVWVLGLTSIAFGLISVAVLVYRATQK